MEWYEKLSEYFPENEMKDEGQMRALLDHHEAYHVYHTDSVVVTYAEFRKFIFIDYLLVNPNTRGKGIGRKVLDDFKQTGKVIFLEVEPPEGEDTDTVRRIEFYERNGFRKAEHIEYTRSDEDGELLTMDIYYWPPDDVSEKTILEQMSTVCREIHNFRALKYYGRLVADPVESLSWVQ